MRVTIQRTSDPLPERQWQGLSPCGFFFFFRVRCRFVGTLAEGKPLRHGLAITEVGVLSKWPNGIVL